MKQSEYKNQCMAWMHSEAVSLIKKGLKKKQIAEELGIHPITVARWLKTFTSEDNTAIYRETRGRKKGTYRALSLADEQKVVSTIRTNTPDRLKLPFFLWNQYAVHDWIKSEFRKDISLRSVRNYFRHWGIYAQISTKNIQTLKQLVGDKWETIDHPTIMKMASKKRARIHWCFPKTSVFIFKDENIPVRNIKPDINYSHAVSNAYIFKSVTNKNELQFMIYENQLTVHTYIRFMEHLVKNTPRHLFTIFHRFRVNDRQLLLHWLSQHKEQVTMFKIS